MHTFPSAESVVLTDIVVRSGAKRGLRSVPLLGWHGWANMELAEASGGLKFAR